MSQKKTNYLNADVELEESTPAVKKKSKKKQNKTLNTVKHVLGVIGTTFLSLFMIDYYLLYSSGNAYCIYNAVCRQCV